MGVSFMSFRSAMGDMESLTTGVNNGIRNNRFYHGKSRYQRVPFGFGISLGTLAIGRLQSGVMFCSLPINVFISHYYLCPLIFYLSL